jgi:hypothetical protein
MYINARLAMVWTGLSSHVPAVNQGSFPSHGLAESYDESLGRHKRDGASSGFMTATTTPHHVLYCADDVIELRQRTPASLHDSILITRFISLTNFVLD